MSERYTIERYLNRPDWLRGRKNGIGASEAAGPLGYGGRSSYSIATDKLTEAIDLSSPSPEAEWGIRHEPSIAKKFTEETMMETIDPGDFTVYRSVEKPWLFCTPDRLIGDDACLEIKTAYRESAKVWNQDIPRRYKVQLQMTMFVTGRSMGYFAALLDGCYFTFHPMKRNDKFLSWAIPKLDAFWSAIQAGEMPDIDGSIETARALALRYDAPIDHRPPVELPDELAELGQQYDVLTATESKSKAEKELVKNRVKAALENRTVGVLPDGSGFAWKGNGSRRFTRLAKVRIE